MNSTPRTPASNARKIEWLLFSGAFLAFAYFHQGGGWNQNGRFALVRAIVEEGTLAIDSYLVYARTPATQSTRLARIPVRSGEFRSQGKDHALWWSDAGGNPVPLDGAFDGVVSGADPRARTLDVAIGQDARVSMLVADSATITRDELPVTLDGVVPGAFVRVESVFEGGGRLVARTVAASNRGMLRERTVVDPGQVACTGDLAFHAGHFHPNKAPGTSFLALPGYFLVHRVERLFGVDPDEWWTLTLNAWLTSVLSVGLLSALGCVLFYRLAWRLSGHRAVASVLTTLAFAFGTMFFPYGTTLYEHNVVAVALLAAFYLLYRARETGQAEGDRLPDGRARLYITLAGACAGWAAITNYLMAAVVAMLGIYAILRVRRRRSWAWFGLGVLGPLLLVCAYNVAAFSTPFTTNYAHENPAFKTGGGALLGVFVSPQWDALPAVLFSPYRGLFFTAPVLLLGLYGLAVWFRQAERGEAWLFTSIALFFLAFMLTFNAWHGGWGVGPRYLSPAVPFLALPVGVAFARFFKTTCTLAAVSAAIHLLVTAVDPQAPVGNAPHATIRERTRWKHSPVTDYLWPLFLEGQALPLLQAQRDDVVGFYRAALQARGEPAPVTDERVSDLRAKIDAAIGAALPAPLLLTTAADGTTQVALSDLPTIVGPVSVNPIGVYEGWMYQEFAAHSEQAYWNSFNLGELLVGRSRWSLAPLVIAVGALAWAALRNAARLDRTRRGDP